jgi:hypothetical protein
MAPLVKAYVDARFGEFAPGNPPSPETANLSVLDEIFPNQTPPISSVTSEIILSPHTYGPQNQALDYMVTLALSWLASKQASDTGIANPGVPAIPSTLPSLADPMVPASVAGIVPALDDPGIQTGVALFPPRQSGPSTRPPDPPPQMPPIVSTDTHVIVVNESDREVDTSVGVQDLDQVSFSVSGTIWAGVALSGRNGPDGWTDVTTDSNYPLHTGPDAHRYALLFRLLDQFQPESYANTPYRFLGKGDGPYLSPYIHHGATRRIMLRINDDSPGNGNGAFTVTITVQRAAQ